MSGVLFKSCEGVVKKMLSCMAARISTAAMSIFCVGSNVASMSWCLVL